MSKAGKTILIISLLFLVSLVSINVMAQSVTQKEANELHDILEKRLNKSEYRADKSKESLLFLLFLEIDTSGSISKLHILSEAFNPDTAFLHLVTLNEFKNWKSVECRNKTIVLPVVIIATDPHESYINDIFSDLLWERQRKTPPLEKNKTILIKSFIYAIDIGPVYN